MDTNYYTLTVDFLGRHKSKIANIIYYPDKKVEYPVGFMYKFMPREKIGLYTIESLENIFNSLINHALFAGIAEDKKRYQIISAFALYNATYGDNHSIFEVPYVRKYLEKRNIPEGMKKMSFAELETYAPALPTFTAHKTKTMHYFPYAQKIIFSGRATIVLWANGTKTVVKCMDGDVYDPEKAVLMAYLEKILGGKSPAKRFLKGCLKDYTPQEGVANDAETQELTMPTVRRIRKENEA